MFLRGPTPDRFGGIGPDWSERAGVEGRKNLQPSAHAGAEVADHWPCSSELAPPDRSTMRTKLSYTVLTLLMAGGPAVASSGAASAAHRYNVETGRASAGQPPRARPTASTTPSRSSRRTPRTGWTAPPTAVPPSPATPAPAPATAAYPAAAAPSALTDRGRSPVLAAIQAVTSRAASRPVLLLRCRSARPSRVAARPGSTA